MSGPKGRTNTDDGNGADGGMASSSPGGGARPLHFVIKSDFMEGRDVQARIMEAVEAKRFPENDVFAIKLALEEALINAIKHGNKFDAAKLVRVDAEVTEGGIEIVIQDQGAGFNRADVPDPLLEENLEKNSGRGILLIESYMSSAEWSDNGRRLRMYKKREAELSPKA